ncbi:MAG: NB-ARC domain-containing protein [Methylobacter sp.]
MADECRDIQQGDKSFYIEKGNVTVHYGNQQIAKNLTRPPFISDVFIGRDDDIAAVHRQLFKAKPLLMLVNGEGGIGKTTLAGHYYSLYQQDYQHMAWVFAEDSLLNALLTLAPPLQIDFPQDWNDSRRLDGLLTRMADLHKPCLLVIDNANNLAELETYYSALRSCSNFHILMTTRITEFEQAACHKIRPLPDKDAITLFKKHYPGHQAHEDPLLQTILAAVGYNTLVIELLAKNLQSHNRLKTRYSLTDLLNDLQQKGLLKLKSQPVSSAYHADGTALRKETPEAIIAAMYDLGELSDAELTLLSVFAVLPAENIAYFLLETLLPDIESLEVTLLGLAQKGWLDNIGSDFKVSPVIQEITRQKNQSRLLHDCHNLIDRLIEKLEYEPGTGHFINAGYQEAAVFAHSAESVVRHIFGANDSLAILCERLGSYHNTVGNLGRALEFYEDDLQLSKELYQAYPDNVSFKNGLAISFIKLGSIFERLEKNEKFREYYIEAKKLLEQLVADSPDYVEFQKNLNWVKNRLGYK